MSSDPQANDSQPVLSQDEVEALLSQAAQEPPSAVAAAVPPAGSAGPERVARRFDFRAPSFLTAAELRQLRLRHEDFVRSLATRLSVYLRLEFGVRLQGLETVSYRRFLDRLGSPVHLTLFRVEPGEGAGLVMVPPGLGLALVDRLLGGPGQAANLEREFTEIELEVLDVAVQLMLKEWCQEVARQPDARVQFVAHESNPRYLPWSDPDASVLLVTCSITLNDISAEVQLAFPTSLIEPVQRQLQSPLPRSMPSSAPAAPPRWQRHLDEVSVPLTASWTGLEITARELAQLKVGDVLQVAPLQMNRVEVCVGRLPKFQGRLGTCERVWAVELTGAL